MTFDNTKRNDELDNDDLDQVSGSGKPIGGGNGRGQDDGIDELGGKPIGGGNGRGR